MLIVWLFNTKYSTNATKHRHAYIYGSDKRKKLQDDDTYDSDVPSVTFSIISNYWQPLLSPYLPWIDQELLSISLEQI